MEDFELNQDTLKKNAQALGRDRRGPSREGPALLQGLAICGKCGKRMTLRYHVRRNKRVPDYICQSHGIEYGEAICQSINGANIDKAICDLVASKMTPASLEASLRVEDELKKRLDEVDRLRKLAVERARYEADLAERHYMHVDPANRLVADVLEAAWNEKIRLLAEAEKTYQQQKARDNEPLGDMKKMEILGLTKDFHVLWNDPAITDKDRKRIIRLIIEDVTLLREDLQVSMKTRFKGGAKESSTVLLPPRAWIQQKTSDEVVKKIDELLDEHTDTEIAHILNEQGFETGRGKKFEEWTIKRLIARRHIKTRFERLRSRGLLTQKELAKKYRVKESTIRTWYRKKLIKIYYYNDQHRFLCQDPGKRPVMVGRSWCLPTEVNRSSTNY